MMREVTIQLVTDSVAHPENLVNRAIMWRTIPAEYIGTNGKKPKRWPVHCRIYFEPWDLTFESTVWGGPMKSGMKVSSGELPCDIKLAFRRELTADQICAGFDKAIDMVNSRAWYAFGLLIFNIVLIPMRRFWAWVYRRTGWAPFNGGSDTDCSMGVDIIAAAMDEDLWPGEPASLTTPGDYLSCTRLEVVK